MIPFHVHQLSDFSFSALYKLTQAFDLIAICCGDRIIFGIKVGIYISLEFVKFI